MNCGSCLKEEDGEVFEEEKKASGLSCFRVKLCSGQPHGIVGALGKPMVLGKAHSEQRQKDDEKGTLPFTVS